MARWGQPPPPGCAPYWIPMKINPVLAKPRTRALPFKQFSSVQNFLFLSTMLLTGRSQLHGTMEGKVFQCTSRALIPEQAAMVRD